MECFISPCSRPLLMRALHFPPINHRTQKRLRMGRREGPCGVWSEGSVSSKVQSLVPFSLSICLRPWLRKQCCSLVGRRPELALFSAYSPNQYRGGSWLLPTDGQTGGTRGVNWDWLTCEFHRLTKLILVPTGRRIRARSTKECGPVDQARSMGWAQWL